MQDNKKPIVFLGSCSAMSMWDDCCKRSGQKIIGILDNDYWLNTDQVDGVNVIGTEQDIEHLLELREKYNFFVATNWDPSLLNGDITERDNQKRQRLIQLVEEYELPLANIIDPSSVIHSNVQIDGGCYIGPMVSLETRVTIGKHTQMYAHCAFAHDVKIGSNCFFNRRVGAWGCTIGNDVYFGPFSVYAGNYRNSHVAENAWIHPGIIVYGRPISEGEIVTIKSQRRTYPLGGANQIVQ